MSKNKKEIAAKHFDVIRNPLITEKLTALSEQDKIGFKVAITSSKKDVKEAVEALFDVKVTKVNMIRCLGKIKRFRGTLGQRPAYKKAIVTLEKGQKIDVMGGV